MNHKDWLADTSTQAAPKSNSMLLLVVFFLFLLMVAAYLWRQQPAWSAIPELPFQSESVDEDEETIALIWERVKQNTDRQTLQAIVYTHNWCVIDRGYPKSELIYIDGGWMIPRMPDRVEIDPRTREFLTRFIRQPEPIGSRVGLDEKIFSDLKD